MNYDRIRSNAKQFLALTSLQIEEFDDLLEPFEESWQAYRRKYDSRGKRRAIGSRSAPKEQGPLARAELRLFFILYYLKTQPLEEALAASFEMDQPRANKWKTKLLPILAQTLQKEGFTPSRNSEDLYEVIQNEEIKDILIDGTERRVNRSIDDQTQEEHYSGKKKDHTVINNLVSDFSDRILYLSPTYEGKSHEMGILREEPLCFPSGTRLWQDLGFQGFTPQGTLTMIPNKKPRKSKLTHQQRWFNQSVSRVRVWVEHAISGVKRLRVVKELLRAIKLNYRDLLIEIACALHNFRLSKRPTKKLPQLFSKIASQIGDAGQSQNFPSFINS